MAQKSRGRPSSYRPEFCGQAYKLCLLGATDVEMADFFGINQDTLYEWKKVHSEFSEAITRGKITADAEVAEKLRDRALGYSHPDVYASSYEGRVTLTPIVKHYPPDTQAASLWLRNRQPAKWRDKQDVEHTGKDGAALIPEVSETELARRLALLLTRGTLTPEKD